VFILEFVCTVILIYIVQYILYLLVISISLFVVFSSNLSWKYYRCRLCIVLTRTLVFCWNVTRKFNSEVHFFLGGGKTRELVINNVVQNKTVQQMCCIGSKFGKNKKISPLIFLIDSETYGKSVYITILSLNDFCDAWTLSTQTDDVCNGVNASKYDKLMSSSLVLNSSVVNNMVMIYSASK
jgi:hypothetical protein